MKKSIILIGTAVLALSALVGCQKKANNGEKTAMSDDKKITVAASATPHSEILEVAKPLLEKDGYTLDVKVFSDYVQPNMVVDSGEIDANYFQHITYLDNFNAEQNTNLVTAGSIHYEPLGIYAGQKTSLDTISKGDIIAVPNDVTNEARALLLLQQLGIIKLKEDAGIKATKNDIVENPNEVEIKELEAAQIPNIKDEVAFVVLNGNYALGAGYNVSTDSLGYETSDSEAAKAYANIVAVSVDNENKDKIKALVNALKSDEVKKFINEKYNGSVIVVD